MTVYMWEARAVAGRRDELVDWLAARLAGDAQLYRSVDGDRVVVVAAGLPPAPPPALLARPAASWAFEPVARPGPAARAQPPGGSG